MALRLVIWLDSTEGIDKELEFDFLSLLGEKIYQSTDNIEYQVEEDN